MRRGRRARRSFRPLVYESCETRALLTGDIPLTGAPYQNPTEPLDVNADAAIEALDSLLIANSLMAHYGMPFPAAELAGLSPLEYQDVNGDDWIGPDDFNLITDWLNNGGNGSPPTPPPPAPPTITVTGPSDVDEKSFFTLSGTAANVSSLWVEVASGVLAFSAAPQLHPDGTWTYENFVLDDNPSGSPDDQLMFTIVAEGFNADQVWVSHQMLVHNVAPTIVSATLSDSEINEGDTVDLQVIFHDKINPAYFTAETEQFTLSIDWGDGTGIETFPNVTLTTLTAANLGIGAPEDQFTYVVTVSHTFLDDNPSNSSQDDYTIVATIADDDSGTATEPTIVTVKNVAPLVTITSIEIIDAQIGTDPATGAPIYLNPGQLDESEGFIVHGTVTDPGRNDTFPIAKLEVDLNWDGDTADAGEVIDLSLVSQEDIWVYQQQILQIQDDGATYDSINGIPMIGNMTESDSLFITIQLEDDDFGSAHSTEYIHVANSPPTIQPFPSIIVTNASIGNIQTATITGNITDIGSNDAHAVTVLWTIGATSARSEVTLAPGATQFIIDYTFTSGDVQVSSNDVGAAVYVQDDDLGSTAICVNCNDTLSDDPLMILGSMVLMESASPVVAVEAFSLPSGNPVSGKVPSGVSICKTRLKSLTGDLIGDWYHSFLKIDGVGYGLYEENNNAVGNAVIKDDDLIVHPERSREDTPDGGYYSVCTEILLYIDCVNIDEFKQAVLSYIAQVDSDTDDTYVATVWDCHVFARKAIGYARKAADRPGICCMEKLEWLSKQVIVVA